MVLKFSGHDSFFCRQFWLIKGFDYATSGKNFNATDAVTELGVGKNMVTAISFWIKAFDIVKDDYSATDLGEFLFGTNGRDRYIEDIGSTWLLHYSLIKKAFSSIYYLVFNEFSKERFEFSKEQLHNYLRRVCNEQSPSYYNSNTINGDIQVFTRNYLKPIKGEGKIEVEEDYSALLIELELLRQKKVESIDTKKTTNYIVLESKERSNLPYQIILFTILDQFENNSISFNELFLNNNSPGRVFCLSKEGLYQKLQEIMANYDGIVFSQTAGNEVLQIKKRINKWEVLDDYYQK
jgi:hypothetical protein